MITTIPPRVRSGDEIVADLRRLSGYETVELTLHYGQGYSYPVWLVFESYDRERVHEQCKDLAEAYAFATKLGTRVEPIEHVIFAREIGGEA